MSHLSYFGLKNFKAFQGEHEFELKPITFLIGKNSSGKSSLTKAIRFSQSLPLIGEKKHAKLHIGDFESIKNILSTEDEVMISLPYYIIGINAPLVLNYIIRAIDGTEYGVKEVNICIKSDGTLIYKSIDDGEILNDMYIFKYEVNWQRIYDEYLKSKDELIETYNLYMYILEKLGYKHFFLPRKEILKKHENYESIESVYDEFIKLNDNSNLIPEINTNSKQIKPFFQFVYSIRNYFDKEGARQIPENAAYVDLKWSFEESKHVKLNSLDQKLLNNFLKEFENNLLFDYLFITKENLNYYKDEIAEICQYERDNLNLMIDENEKGHSYYFLSFSHLNESPSLQHYFKDNDSLNMDSDTYHKDPYYAELIEKIKNKVKLTIGTSENSDVSMEYSNLYYFNLLKKEMLEYGVNENKSISNSIEYVPSYRLIPERYFNYSDQEKSFFHNFIITLKNQNWIEYQKDALDWIKKFEIADSFDIKDIKDLGIKIVSLNKNGMAINLQDVGYGHLQLLPLILKCCIEKPKILILEEPEANLHPALHSKLAEFLIFCQKKYGTQFIIETHSEYMIRKMQSLIAAGDFQNDRANIYYFHDDADIKDPKDKVKKINFEHNGILSDTFGPGFYDEADKLSLQLLSLTYGQKN